MPDNNSLLKRITARPDVFGGKPIIRNMRISVELILGLMSQGATQEELLDDFPELEPEDIRASPTPMVTGTRWPHLILGDRAPVGGVAS